MISSQIVNANTPKGGAVNDKAELPSAYEVNKLECVNSNGKAFDIFPLVTSFTITEELFSPVLVMNLKIRDTFNFFEDFAVSGEETINIHLQHITASDAVKTIKLSFKVKEYPNYEKRAESPNVAEYSIVAVSPFGYFSMLQRISKSVKGNPMYNIVKIFEDNLGVQTETPTNCISSFDGIITVQTPLKAIEWLRTKAFDVTGSPFFVYSNIWNSKVMIKSLSELWSKSNMPYRKYEYRQFITNIKGSLNSYNENALRIIDMRSNIKLDKLGQAIRGGFASKTNITDVASKTFTESVFDVTSDESIAGSRLGLVKSLFSPNKNLTSDRSGAKSFNELTSASVSSLSVNSMSNYGGNPNSSSGPIQDNISRAKSYYANLEAMSHQIQVYGDFSLNPGRKITIEIPKSVNPNEYAPNSNNDNNDELDRSMSGDYIVAAVAHTFRNGVYTSKLKIIKDA